MYDQRSRSGVLGLVKRARRLSTRPVPVCEVGTIPGSEPGTEVPPPGSTREHDPGSHSSSDPRQACPLTAPWIRPRARSPGIPPAQSRPLKMQKDRAHLNPVSSLLYPPDFFVDSFVLGAPQNSASHYAAILISGGILLGPCRCRAPRLRSWMRRSSSTGSDGTLRRSSKRVAGYGVLSSIPSQRGFLLGVFPL